MSSVYVAKYRKPHNVIFNQMVYKQTAIHPQVLMIDGKEYTTTMVEGDVQGLTEAGIEAGKSYKYIVFNYDVYEKTKIDPAITPDLLKVVAIWEHGDYGPKTRVYQQPPQQPPPAMAQSGAQGPSDHLPPAPYGQFLFANAPPSTYRSPYNPSPPPRPESEE
ncbi:uncharacterized protein LY89DRAFT_716930 [Mollisia scopiformis]|uniref:Uncharacterized protein n=1 Tax=Mollisia scopiformis TaxID=149040 RepID=A0A194XH13_MOLSC|nr:uncharacterized protein LY89DRAFT_716930 [Mollisia scopiformis]KUJ19419.1 hypothetical protein LY89DRAFT_716930 [Mollisia scopiformis]